MTPAGAVDDGAGALNFHLKNPNLHLVPKTIYIPQAELPMIIKSLANIFMGMARKKKARSNARAFN
jgi:hypothetical protein